MAHETRREATARIEAELARIIREAEVIARGDMERDKEAYHPDEVQRRALRHLALSVYCTRIYARGIAAQVNELRERIRALEAAPPPCPPHVWTIGADCRSPGCAGLTVDAETGYCASCSTISETLGGWSELQGRLWEECDR